MKLITPYGEELADLIVTAPDLDEAVRYATTLQSVQLTARSECDLELLATGALSPLDRFMGRADYERVVDESRLADGRLYPIPVTLPVDRSKLPELHGDIALRNAKNDLLAVMTVEEIFERSPREARAITGTADPHHPLVREMERWGSHCISGRLRVLQLPKHHDFRDLRRTPAEVRKQLELSGHDRVVAFQTRNPMHRAHEELTRRAMERIDGALLLHPAVGMTKPGDVDHYTRVRTYRALTERYYPRGRVLLSLLPLAMRMAGPREALWHAIIRRNYGATHFIIGRDHASPGLDSNGRPFYGPEDAQKLLVAHAEEIGVEPVVFSEMVYVVDEDRYEESSRISPQTRTRSISGTQVRDGYLAKGVPLPEWFTRPETAAILAEAYPPRHQQGVCVWLTGLPSSGKSATAEALVEMLLQAGRQSTLLDGDVVRTHLSKGLGFSKEDRDTNIRRIGFVASEIARHGGAVVCAAVSPYRAIRDEVRAMVGSDRFIEVFVSTPIEECEARDAKGLYAQARRGVLKNFTGVDDPYEAPLAPEVTLDTIGSSVEANASAIIDLLAKRGFVRQTSEG